MTKVSVFLLAILGIAVCDALRYQSVGVKGKLLCGSAPAKNVRVKLWDEDGGPDPDDLLDQGYTDANGEFLLKGGTTELTNIDAIFKIYHDCDDGIKPGSRKVKFQIPNSYVFDAQEPKKIFDIGVLNLETIFAKEERELIVSKRRRSLIEDILGF
uniref:Transthyretin-like family protein n=1 Tax=Panagrolaimus sp. JU765 TaxID=591449 RepID=A0AC34QR21_9BILA